MIRWTREDRRRLLRRLTWAGVLSAALHAVVLALVELPDPEAMLRADWPALDVRLAKLTLHAISEKPRTDAPVSLGEEFSVAATVPKSTQGPKAVAKKKARAKPVPPTPRQVVQRPARAPQPRLIMAGPVTEPPSPDGDPGPSSGAEPNAVAAERSADAAERAARAFPRKLELEYSVLESEGRTVLGWMVYRFEREGDRYRMRLAVDAIGVASFFVKGRYVQHSEGRLTADGLRPERFMVRRGKRERVERASFDWQTSRATLSDARGSRDWALQAGAQDLLSVIYQISFVMEEKGNPPAVMVTDGRRFQTAHLEIVGRETVQTELGPMETVRIRSALERGATVELWLAPDFGYLPARVQLRDKRGREAEQILASVKVQW